MRRIRETNHCAESTIAALSLIVMTLLGIIPNVVSGQIDVNETNLHSGEFVYALEATTASPPYVNLLDISFWAWGATDANLYTDVHFLAYGLSSDVGLDNSGAVNVNAIGGSATSSSSFNGDVNGYGVYSDSDVSNTGSLTVSAIAGEVHAVSAAIASASAYGFMVPSGNITNSGDVTVLAAGGTTDGGIQATAPASARGIVGSGDVSNSGAINVMAVGGDASADTTSEARVSAYASAQGVRSSSMVENTGDITVTAVGGTAVADATSDSGTKAYAHAFAHGIDAYSDVDNAGNISVTVTAGSADANEGDAYAYGYAYGVSAEGDITNTADMAVTVTAGVANAPGTTDTSATAYGLFTSQGDVNNAGDMDVVATTDGTSLVYGIYMGGDGTLTNTGTVRVSGDTAYEVYVAGGTVTLVDTYNVALDGDPNRGSLGVADGATLDLNDAKLTVTHVAGETLWDRDYRLFEVEGSGVVDGNFAEAEPANPNVTLTYNDQGTSSAADDTVALSFTPTGSAFTGSTAVERQLLSQSGDMVHHRMTNTLLQSIVLPDGPARPAEAGVTGPYVVLSEAAPKDESVGIFIEPYYSQMDKDPDPVGHDARLWGFAAGYERRFDETLVCLHVGRGQADIDYTGQGFTGNSEEQEIFTAGFSALTRRNDWTLRYGVSGFYAWQDYRGLTGLELTETETASTNSYGVVASAMAGRLFRRGSHVFLPEAGFNYLWGHRDSYTTQASEPAWDTTYSEMDEHDIEAEASLRWLAGFTFKDLHVAPSASVGVRHLLTDDDSAVSLSIPGAAPIAVHSTRDRTAMTLSSSVTFTGDIHTVSLAYDGEYSTDSDRHSFWLRYGWQF